MACLLPGSTDRDLKSYIFENLDSLISFVFFKLGLGAFLKGLGLGGLVRRFHDERWRRRLSGFNFGPK